MMGAGKIPGDDALQDYFDSLLSDGYDTAAYRADEPPLKVAAGSNIAPLPTAMRSARSTAPIRPYAEPIRTINLRMPLPPVAPAKPTNTVPVSAPTVETPSPVGESPPAEPKTAVAEPMRALLTEPGNDESIAQKAIGAELSMAAVAAFETMAPPADWHSNGRPQWAQQPFECLLFKAGGLLLAAPLVELGSIYPLEAEALTSIFGQTAWFMGLLPVKEYNVRAMDTALVVMPERYNAMMREHYRYVVTLFGSDWGLAVDEVVGTTILSPDDIRWRGQRAKRPWLAGTLVERMCALFDIAQLAWLFHLQDRKRAANVGGS